MSYPRIVIAGTHSGVGKTTVTIGLMAALTQRGHRVQGFKAGPDYIDPSHHTAVTGISSRNLDTWMLGDNEVLELFERSARHADISIVEGVMGLYDGYSGTEERGSTAHLAKLLNAPVLLVINARSLARSAGALVLGYCQFDPDVRVAGVIVNNIGSSYHFELIRSTIETNVGVPVLGCLERDPEMTVEERHLGLVPQQEISSRGEHYRRAAMQVSKQIDMDRLLDLARTAGDLPDFARTLFTAPCRSRCVRFGIARDEAFHFYYQDGLDLLEHLGAELVDFSPLHDAQLPANLDVLYIGGGFPELFAERLSHNVTMMRDIRKHADAGKPIYAECGGLMYLSEGIRDFEGHFFEMVGVLPVRTQMEGRRSALGYVQISTLRPTILGAEGTQIRGHEFHWSSLEEVGDVCYAYRSTKRRGNISKHDGIVVKNVLASYAHIHFASHPDQAIALVESVEK